MKDSSAIRPGLAPVIRLGRIVGAAPGVTGAFGSDIEAALEDRDDS